MSSYETSVGPLEGSEATLVPMTPNVLKKSEPMCLEDHTPATVLESLYWQSLGWVHSPPFKRLDLDKGEDIQVPPSREVPDDLRHFFKKGFDPKVQVENRVPYGAFPKSVAIDLERRRFRRQDLTAILNELGLDASVIRPAIFEFVGRTIQLKPEATPGVPMEPFLDLHLFDDDCFFESRSPEEWMSLGSVDEKRKPIAGIALVPADDGSEPLVCEWQPVAVMRYDSKKAKYLVRPEGGFPREEADFDFSERVTDLWVHRIYLKFGGEEPEDFAKRLYSAVSIRHTTEESLRLCYYVECMPVEGAPVWRSEDLDYIIRIVRRSRLLKPDLQWIKDHLEICTKELQLEYRRAYNYDAYRDVAGQVPCLMADFESGKLVGKPHRRGYKVEVDYCFQEVFELFELKTFWNKPEVVRALHQVQENILSLDAMSLYCMPLPHIMNVDEFETAQRSGLQSVSEYVHGDWITDIAEAIVSNMEHCGKGSYDLNQKATHTYQYTKLSKLLKTVTFMMQDVIRYLINDSLAAYATTFEEACSHLHHVKEDFEWTDSFSSDDWGPLKGEPIFEVPLEIKGMHLEFAVELKKYRDVVTDIFKEGLNVTQGLPQLEKLTMRRMLFSSKQNLETVYAFETQVVNWRKSVVHGMDKALIAAQAYVKSYDDALRPLKTDQINYVKHLARMKTPCEKLKRVVEMHIKEKERLSIEIPAWMDIGPFRLMTESVRIAAVRKHETLADAVLVHFYDKLRQYMEELNDNFLMLRDRIDQPTGNIEDLLDKKQWCRTVPQKIKRYSLDVHRLRSDYSLICTFHRNLEDDDFAAYWRLLGLPHQTALRLERRVARFEGEREQHRIHLVHDQRKLVERLQELDERIEAFRECWDREKAAVNGAQVRVARKDVSKYEERSLLYNKRERLFGLPVTVYKQIKVISKKLEPYERLWVSVSDFYKYRVRELTEHLEIEKEQRASMLSDFQTKLGQCSEFFTLEEHPEIHSMIDDVLVEIVVFERTKLE